MNTYNQWEGYGRVVSRAQVVVIDSHDNEIGEYRREQNPEAYDDLGIYVPLPNENKVRFAIRWAPPGDRYLQLLLAGDWHADARILETLKFTTENGRLPLESKNQQITLNTTYWYAYGTVIVDNINLNGVNKLFSRVRFRNQKDPSLTVAAFWCWPY